MRQSLLVIFACLGLLIPVQAKPLKDHFSGLSSLSGRFTQTVTDNNGHLMETTQGILLVKVPDRFRIQYTEPYRQLYVADSQKLWFFDEDLEQVTVRPQGDLLTNSPAMVLSDPESLPHHYRIEQLPQKDNQSWYRLKPKQVEHNFDNLLLGFQKGRLKTMLMKDNLGQTTRLVFSSMAYNNQLSMNEFLFSPPPGIDVIGED